LSYPYPVNTDHPNYLSVFVQAEHQNRLYQSGRAMPGVWSQTQWLGSDRRDTAMQRLV